MELWELITGVQSWCKDNIAETADGRVVPPHHPEAVKFSLIGGLKRCYLQEGLLWSPDFEVNRNKVFTAIRMQKPLRDIMKQVGYSSLKEVALHELNQNVNFSFIFAILSHMRTKKEGA